MNPEQAKALRAPFPKSAIGKMPKGGVSLDFVGHAATTDRLLAVDPEWSWEPVAYDPRGLPGIDEHGGLWIRLTVAGVTRLGYGDAGGKKGPNAIKEAIGDAIRNAAMRFGVALDLWAKEDIANTTPPVAVAEPVEPPALTRPVERLTTTPADDPWSTGEVAAEGASPVVPSRNARGTDDTGPFMRNPGGKPSDKARGMMFALLKGDDGKARPREENLAIIAGILGREVASSDELTAADVSAVIDALKAAAA